MRTTIILLLAALLCSATAQAQDIPVNITKAFSSKHPNVKETKWDIEDNMYEVSFKEKGTEASIIYREDGTIAETEHEIKVSELPRKAQEFARSKGKIKEASKIVVNGIITYEAEVSNEDLLFDSNGKFIKSKQIVN